MAMLFRGGPLHWRESVVIATSVEESCMPFWVYYVKSSGPEARIPVSNLVIGREGFPSRADAEASLPEAAETMRSFGQPVPEFQIIEADNVAAAMSQATGMPLPPDARQG